MDLTGEPAYPFGYGLSYTQFEYSALRIEPAIMKSNGRATVTFHVRNVGTRAGDEVPQLYIRPLVSPVAQPVMALEAFGRIHLAAGEERDVSFTLSSREMRILDEHLHWVLPTGTAVILIGASSKDIRLRGQLQTHVQ